MAINQDAYVDGFWHVRDSIRGGWFVCRNRSTGLVRDLEIADRPRKRTEYGEKEYVYRTRREAQRVADRLNAKGV